MGNSAAGRAGNCEVIVEVSGGGCGGRQVYQAVVGNIRRGRDGGRVCQAVGTAAGEWGGRLGGGGHTELRSRA